MTTQLPAAPPHAFADSLAHDDSSATDAPHEAAHADRSVRARVERGRVVTFLSLKGGVGTSSLALASAARAARSGVRTIAVDLDVASGDLALLAGVDPPRTLVELALDGRDVDDAKLAAYTTHDRDTGLDVLAAPRRPDDAELLQSWRVRDIVEMAAASWDLVVIDTTSAFDDRTLVALDASTDIVVVLETGVGAAKAAAVTIDTLRRLRLPARIHLASVDRRGSRGGLRRADIERAVGAKVDIAVPFDREFAERADRGCLAALVADGCDVEPALRRLDAITGADQAAAAGRPRRRRFVRSRRRPPT